MSYSFNVIAVSKEAAKAAIAAKFDEIVAQQPVHERDRAAVIANANASIDLVDDDDTRDISVSCSGYLSWAVGESEPVQLIAAAVGTAVGFVERAARPE